MWFGTVVQLEALYDSPEPHDDMVIFSVAPSIPTLG